MAKSRTLTKNAQRRRRTRNYRKETARLIQLGNPETYVPIFEQAIKAEQKQAANNAGKLKGRPKTILDAVIAFGVFIHFYLGLPYRQAVGHLQYQLRGLGVQIPCYQTLQRRASQSDLATVLPRAPLRGQRSVAIDSTGFTPSNRGHYICEKWGLEDATHNGWIKAHFVVDTKTHQILAYLITDNHVGDSTGAMILLRRILTDRKNVYQLFGDRAYDFKALFNLLDEKSVKPGIRLKAKASTKARGCPLRAKEAQYLKQNGYEDWRDTRHYGRRQAVEQENFLFKNFFGERVTSKTEAMIDAEFRNKIAINNWVVSLSV